MTRIICRLLSFTSIISLLSGCYKKDIQFGTELAESFTQLLQVDTVNVNMSTYVIDSFPTSADTAMLFGSYTDPELGTISTKSFFQLTIPTELALSDDALYDSISLTIKLNRYYYGDTSLPLNIVVNELADPLEYSYNAQLFNTSSIREMTLPLVNQSLRISPRKDDSLVLRLPYAKGAEMFARLINKSPDLITTDGFVSYFKGLSVSISQANGAVFGFDASTDAVVMRLHYHNTIPYPEKHTKDFPINGSGIHFVQILSDRKGTALETALNDSHLVGSGSTNNQAYVQSNSGLLLKLDFPSLKNVLQLNTTVRLLKATLVMHVAANSFVDHGLDLPTQLFLAETNGTNTMGNYVYSADGNIVTATPVYDNIYSGQPTYSFDVTTQVNAILTGEGTAENGFFLMDNSPGSGGSINRAVFYDTRQTRSPSTLILSVLTLKN